MGRRTFLALFAAPLVAAEDRRPVRIDPDGMLRIAGTRKFMVGLYQLPNRAQSWAEAARAGFNLVRVAPQPEQLDIARAHGMYAWTGLGSISPDRPSETEARIRKMVQALKDKPALLFWETEDEPTYVWRKPDQVRIPPEDIIATRNFVRRIDPEHPFYLNHSPTNLVSTLQRYNPGTDIIATDIYPVVPHGIREMFALWPDGQQGDFLNREISQVGQYADKMRRVAGPSRTVLLVLQAFAWENFRKQDRNPAMVLYPNRSQLRFMTYQAIAHGVNGVLYYGLSSTPADAGVWTDLKSVASELSQLKEELAAPTEQVRIWLQYHETGHSLDRGIESIMKPSRNGAVLVAVNADKNPVDVSLSGLDRFRRCEVLFEPRQITFAEGVFRDSFAPFQARVYRLMA